ncbi:MAG: bifunctional precorrin-2 dehydrogenase/sirohydrochlorin ferrochelatase [Leptospiraceae bacterium]|nr:bifunctional precorrin-2 dehydrogenase/sirohydrochlorin ferrochelatase [Leptospiraceae bacterium]MCZ8346837.1 bifunctional precorrin-2 dehydrogenase/sirohydrochlorin ferrochelatase [Leptospiraceae bacterium]
MIKKYPAFLNLEGRNVLLIGGGNVAMEKLPNLVLAHAKVTVISLHFNEECQSFLLNHPQIHKEQREIRLNDLDERDLIFSATNNKALNAAMVEYARDKRIWINSCDDPNNCDFYSASVFDRGPIRIAVSTDGRFAGLGSLVKKILNDLLPEDHNAEWEDILQFRNKLKTQEADPAKRKKILQDLLKDLETKYFNNSI